MDILTIIALFGAVYLVYLWKRYPKDFPPHPTFSIPFLGDVDMISSSAPKAIKRLRAKHGDVFGCIVGPQRIVVLSDYDLIQEAGARDELVGRIVFEFAAKDRGSVEPANFDKFPGVLQSRGRLWQEQRRFSLHALRDLGFGKNNTEELAREEADELCQYLESSRGEPIDIRNKFNTAILNVLWRITTSERLHYDDPKLMKLLLLLDRFIQEAGKPLNNMIAQIKGLNWLVGKTGLLAFSSVFKSLRGFVDDALEPVKSTYQEDSLRNFVDHYLKMIKVQDKSQEANSFSGKEGEANLVNVLIDLFIAGSETTSTTLSWGMLYMILHPEIQEKVHEELDEVIGKGIQPVIGDRVRTPYTEAVLLEVQRLGNILDRSVPHGVLADCRLSTGHFIPKDTLLLCNIGAVMSDPKVFPEPERFDPTRYLDKSGAFKPHPRVIPFGVGRRRCLGEVLARMELYLFFTSILSRFKLEKANPGDYLTTEPIEGAVLSPSPYKLRFTPR